jgi:adenine-specific DNA-methyltransferase
VSTLSDLLQQVEHKDPQLAADLAREVAALAQRREFGLNFERHTPETVELPGRPVRRGDKVRFLAPRGESTRGVDRRLWRVASIARTDDGRVAAVVRQDTPESDIETAARACDDLVVVAEFRDPIYPGLLSTGRVERGGDKPFHAVINAENFHALQTLLYTHEGKVDAIYIDPPYNTRDKDWKYNNNYVDNDDQYRHSKWLAFMERRLKMAKRLLNPERSVLIVAIDHNEVHRLGLLLEQVFQGHSVQVVSTLVNPRGQQTAGSFARSEDYLFFVTVGSAVVAGERDPDYGEGVLVPWRTFRRSDIESKRGTIKGGSRQFYPVYVNTTTGRIDAVGEPLPHDVDRNTAPQVEGCVAVFPLRDNGTELNWGLTPDKFKGLVEKGYARVGRATPTKPQLYEISYFTEGKIRDIIEGRAVVEGYDESGAAIARYVTHKLKMPISMWTRESHNAEVHGTGILKSLFGGDKNFPYPKSLYAVEDCLRYFIGDNRKALVVDFFAGSGTTGHAVMRLNRQDGGQRRSVVVTNNEVSAEEAAALTADGHRPGDDEWESKGICEVVTKPRLEAAVTGRTPTGALVEGTYRFIDEFPMSDGLEENVEFFTMTYEAHRSVAHNRAFEAVAPLLWLKAGAEGARIESAADDFAVADTYGVLFDLDCSHDFLSALASAERVRMAFIVTDDDRAFQMVCGELPPYVEPVRLYESYLTNFTINTGRE